MLKTEDAAKQQWCPLARVPFAYSEAVAVNRDATGPERGTNCVASACMAWRRHVDRSGSRPTTPLGYCGAFGKPEI